MLSFSRRIIVLFLSCVLFEGTIAHSGHDEHSIGEIELVDGKRKALPPLRELERKATTAVELTCLRAFRENMGSPEEVIIQTGDSGQGINWCEALDETPFVADPNKYFVLIRMKLYYVKDFRLSPTKDRNLYFIIIASRTLDDEFNEMEIVNILPRIPCVATHTEEISNIQVFEKENYFTTTTSTGERIPGCFDRSWGKYHFHTYVDRITFTGRESNHLFLYGSRLIQSNDAGRTYILLRTLTAPIDPRQKPDPYDTLTLHQITVMAFDSEGHYAFLTNANELWFGSTGDTRQIILRGIKSDGGHSMMQTMVTSFNASFPYASPTIDHLYIEAQPVGLFFDDQDVLYEIVVLWNWVEGEEMITTRRIPVDMMMRYNKFYLDLLLLSAGHVKANKSTYHFVYDVKRFSAYCPMSSVKFYENFIVEGSVNAQTDAKPQIESDSDSANNDHPAKWTINIATTHLVWKGVDKLVSSGYETSSLNPERFDRWILKKQEFATVAQLRFITAEKLSSKSNGNRLLKEYYIDYGSTLRLELYYSTNTDAVVALLAQNRPGENLIGYHLIFHLIGGFPTCGKRLSDPFASSAQSTVLRVGCRPSTSILFNWNETLYSIQFKDQDAHYGRGDECYDNEFVCFFARAPLVFHFDIYDIAKQTYVPYTGNYVMRIIAGGYEKDKMDNYTLEQQEGYNIPGTSDVSLIWNEWDLVASQKIDRPPPHFDADSTSEEDNIKKTHRERVLQAGVSAIQWACHTLSPCARVVPNAAFQTVFWFRISISNRYNTIHN
ncbi:Cation channel sperm-associated protein subunit gamma 1 [Folsomia candida]|uniref:Cation channel sperm-associated protein subunit gamma 1 n=1 Tax=Folsomia candida TaxID=158441 RepID=A0A226ECJ1_FOLCA|nr:Cation channel sperm-associated protein subunit gamma 1 [Folsomia candida]